MTFAWANCLLARWRHHWGFPSYAGMLTKVSTWCRPESKWVKLSRRIHANSLQRSHLNQNQNAGRVSLKFSSITFNWNWFAWSRVVLRVREGSKTEGEVLTRLYRDANPCNAVHTAIPHPQGVWSRPHLNLFHSGLLVIHFYTFHIP
jgi:hypothetical protein